MFENGRPRYWIDWYDRWYLLLPLLLAAVLITVWQLPVPVPTPEPRSSSVQRTPPSPVGPSQAGSLTHSVLLPPRIPTTLLSPPNGKGFFPSRIPDAEGQAEPGAMIHLEYTGLDLVWHELSHMPTDATGHFQFQLSNFPPGNYRLRALAVTKSGRRIPSGETMITIAAEPPRQTRRRARNQVRTPD